MKDDFVAIPPVLVAGLAPGAAADAERVRKQEAAKVDARLFQSVSLHLKAASLEDLCRQLSIATGVPIRAARGVGDEKVTVLLENRPARDVMRAIARLFDYQWQRSGEEGAYRYELRQDLLSQLAEQEMRNRDLRAALLELDRQMRAYAPYLDETPEQLKAREKSAGADEKELLGKIDGAGWGGAELYNRLTPAELATLANGQKLDFGDSESQPDRALPNNWRGPLLSIWGDQAYAEHDGAVLAGPADELRSQGFQPLRIAEDPTARLALSLHINRSELGQLSLESQCFVEVKKGNSEPGFGKTAVLAVGRSPSTASPNNGPANRELRREPAFRRVVSFNPKPSCRNREPAGHSLGQAFYDVEAPPLPHVNAADVWDEVHRVSGLPIVTDSYTRLYPLAPVTVEQRPLFDALCQVGDVMGIRWRRDGKADDAILLARSTSYFWDKLKEVPNRLLEGWQADRVKSGGLPFEDLIEMASMSDPQLDSDRVRQGIAHCWELPEWRLVSSSLFGGSELMRPYARIVAALGARDARAIREPEGVPFTNLGVDQQRQLFPLVKPRIVGPEAEVFRELQQTRVRADYVPAGYYVWHPTADRNNPGPLERLPVVSGKTADEALEAARHLWPAAARGEIERTTEGVFTITFLWPNGNAFSFGARPINFR